MLRLAGCMPGLTSAETSDMIHELLNDEIEYIHEMEKDRKKDRVFGVDAGKETEGAVQNSDCG